MLNTLWPIFIVASFIYAFFSGNIDNVNNSIFESAEDTVKLTLTLLGTICLWNGIIAIAEKTSFMDILSKILSPFIKFLFLDLKNYKKIKKEISMNIIANILGLGNAATSTGLKVMKSLQEKNEKKDTVSNLMAMFIVINTASLQLIPTTVIAIRNSLNSKCPTQIILPIWFATICAAITAIMLTKICTRRSR